MEITVDIAKKVLETVDAGLCRGKGEPIPGKMCVEAAVAYAMGEPHSDSPVCVDEYLRDFKISLNDKEWASDKSRAAGLRRVAIAQLGSAGTLNWNQFKESMLTSLMSKDKALQQAIGSSIVELRNMLSLLETASNRVQLTSVAFYDLPLRDALQEALYDYEDVNEAVEHVLTVASDYEQTLEDIAEMAVQALKEQNIPGTNYLYLTEDSSENS